MTTPADLILEAFPGTLVETDESGGDLPGQCSWGGCAEADALVLTRDSSGLIDGWCFKHYPEDALPLLVNTSAEACEQCGKTATTATRKGTVLHPQCRRPYATRLAPSTAKPKGAYARRRP